MAQGDRPRNLNSHGPSWPELGRAFYDAVVENPVQSAVMASQAVPIVGDVAGLAYDAYDMATNPESRTWGNAALAAAGVLPFVPGGLNAAKRIADDLPIGHQPELPGLERAPGAEGLGMTEDVYHYTRSGDGFDEFDPDMGTDNLSVLGPHVGTKQAAEERWYTEATHQLPRFDKNHTPLEDPDWSIPEHAYQSDRGRVGHTLPMKARTDKPFTVPGTDGEPWNEDDLMNLVYNVAGKDSGPSVVAAQKRLRQQLADQGYTHIPYVNQIEDPGSISYIMLTERPGEAVLRSRNAAFDPTKAKSKNIMASGAGLAGAGTLGALMAGQREPE